uniref:Uncharacterized protein n=1 Tax=Caenorhabditis tropicalis TaxID=1561998 RepID=A0A1I7TP85_9PELO
MNANLERSRSSTYRTIKNRAYDLVLEDDSDEDHLEIPVQIGHPLIQDGLKLISSITGKNGISARVLSPRIAPLSSSHSKGILSPSIFPFYKDDVEEQFFPIPDMIKLLNPEKQSFSTNQEKEAVLSATDKMSQDFENLENSLNREQKIDLKEMGFSLLEMPQMKDLFGKYEESKEEGPFG